MSDKVELLPCPFCGGAAKLNQRETESLWSHNIVTWSQVGCCECECVGADCCEDDDGSDAVTHWNTRATIAQQPATAVKIDEQAEFEKLRGEQIAVLERNGYPDGANAFYGLGSVQWSGWQARARLAAPPAAEQPDSVTTQHEPVLHWHSLSFLDSARNGAPVNASVYIGWPDQLVTKPRIDAAKLGAGVGHGAMLLACCYMGHATRPQILGEDGKA